MDKQPLDPFASFATRLESIIFICLPDTSARRKCDLDPPNFGKYIVPIRGQTSGVFGLY